MNVLTLLLSVCEKLVVKDGYNFLRVTVFRKFVQNRSYFISSPGSKVKVSYIFHLFWPMHVRKMEVFTLSPLVSFSVAAKWKSKCLSQSFQLWDTLLSNEKAWGGYSLSMTYWKLNIFTVNQNMLKSSKLIDKRRLLNKLKRFFWHHAVFLV